jgi:ABC-type transport system involved in multi-copper enzyme maturation permease subunit
MIRSFILLSYLLVTLTRRITLGLSFVVDATFVIRCSSLPCIISSHVNAQASDTHSTGDRICLVKSRKWHVYVPKIAHVGAYDTMFFTASFASFSVSLTRRRDLARLLMIYVR